MKTMQQCNCENNKCLHHGDGTMEDAKMCTNAAGTKRLQYVGACCDACYDNMPEEYRVKS